MPTPDATGLVERRVPFLFLALGFIIGTLYVFLMPPMQIPDEMSHFVRAYSVSRGVCIPSPDIDTPQSLATLNEIFPPWLNSVHKISFEDISLAFDIPLNPQDMAGGARERSLKGFINQNAGHCVSYLPEALALNLGRHTPLPALALLYLCRMTNLACYLGITFLALRLIPGFRMLLFSLALMPMTLHQAASASADSMIFAVSLFFPAYVLYLAFGRPSAKLAIRQYLLLAALLAFLVLTKSFLCMILLLLLIPADRFPSPRARWLVISGIFLVAVGCEGFWQYVNHPTWVRKLEEGLPKGIDIDANVRFMREHPLGTAHIYARCLMRPPFLYSTLQGFVGNLGFLCVQLPDWVLWTYFVLLVAAAATQAGGCELSVIASVVLFVFLAASIATALSIGWIGSMPKPVLDDPLMRNNVYIPMQGRYWIPFAFPCFLLLTTGRTLIHPRVFGIVAAAIVIVANSVALRMVISIFYR